jgi:hypothetical protein
MKKFLFPVCFLLLSFCKANAQHYIPLLNGKNLDGWYVFLDSTSGSQNKDSAFIVKDHMLYVTGKSVGYICTKKQYKNFHLIVEFKWGEKKYPPRMKDKRDSGVIYYFATGKKDKIWPQAYECQVQEGDCGDFWLADSISLNVHGKTYTKERVPKLSDHEKPNGEWNTLEVIANNGRCTHIVNGVVVNEGTNANVRDGKIALQTEAAEMYYRNIRIAIL